MDWTKDSDFVTSLLIGAVVLWVYAWDQFNRPSYERSQEFSRMLELLAPSDMRKGLVYLRAYVLYAALLTLIYFVLCTYASVGVLTQLGFPGLEVASTVAGADKLPETARGGSGEAGGGFEAEAEVIDRQLGPVEKAPGRDPTIPLIIGLAMIGIAPNVPVLVRFEERIRLAAHRLSGIPTRLLASARRLSYSRLPYRKNPQGGYQIPLIPTIDLGRIRHYCNHAASRVEDIDAFENALIKIIAFKRWVLSSGVVHINLEVVRNYQRLHNEITDRIQRLIFDLDKITGFSPVPTPGAERGAQDHVGPGVADPSGLIWAAAVKEVDQVCADICLLLMLFYEHRAFEESFDDEYALRGRSSDKNRQKERAEAQEALLALIERATKRANRDGLASLLFFRVTFVVVVTSFTVNYFIGDTGRIGEQPGGWGVAFGYAMSTLLTYAPALLTAISVQHGKLQENTWDNVFTGKKMRACEDYVVVFIAALAAALFFGLFYNIFSAIRLAGVDAVSQQIVPVLVAGIRIVMSKAAIAAVFALWVILFVDAWHAGRLKRQRVLFLAGQTAVLSLLAGGARLMTTLSNEQILDWWIVLYAAIGTGALGLTGGLVASVTLIEETDLLVLANGSAGFDASETLIEQPASDGV